MEPPTGRDPAFPPWWVALVTASVISVLAFVALFLSGIGENISESQRSRQNWGIVFMVVAVLPSWLSYFFANHDHDLHAAVAYCLGVALCVVGLAIAI